MATLDQLRSAAYWEWTTPPGKDLASICASECLFTSAPDGLDDRLIAFPLGGWSGFFRWFGPVYRSLRLLGHPAALATSTFEET